jgi:hypothetical protein
MSYDIAIKINIQFRWPNIMTSISVDNYHMHIIKQFKYRDIEMIFVFHHKRTASRSKDLSNENNIEISFLKHCNHIMCTSTNTNFAFMFFCSTFVKVNTDSEDVSLRLLERKTVFYKTSSSQN